MVYKPFNNDLGQRIYDNVSQRRLEGSGSRFSVMIVNEYRLDPTSPQGQKLLMRAGREVLLRGGDTDASRSSTCSPEAKQMPRLGSAARGRAPTRS